MKTDFERIYPKMTPEEQNEYMYLAFYGYYNSRTNTVMMGQAAYDAVMQYQHNMYKKYLPEILLKEEKAVTLKNKPKQKSEQTWKKKWKKNQ